MAPRHDASPDALITAKKREAGKPGRTKAVGRGSGLTKRVREGIDLLVFGSDLEPKNRLKQAAERSGISERALRAAMLKPSVDGYYKRQLAAYREGLKAVALNTVENVMTDPALMNNAAGAKVRLDAAKTALNENGPAGISVQLNTQINVTPGYAIDLTEEPRTIVMENQ